MKRALPFLLILALSTCALSTPTSNVITVYPVEGDDTTNIQQAFDRLTDGLGNHAPALLEFEPGVYEVNGVLDLKDKYRAVVDGQTAVITGDFSINASGSYIDIYNLYLHSDADIPAFIYGRNENGSGGNIRLHNVQVFVTNEIGAVLWGQADNSMLDHCEIWNGGTGPSLILTSENETGLLDWPASTETFVEIRGGWIHGSGDVLVSMRGLVQNAVFDSVFFSPEGTAAVEAVGEVHNLSFPNSRSEGLADAVLLRVLGSANVVDLTNYVHAVVNAQYILDVRGDLNYLTAPPFITRSNSSTQLATVTGSLLMMDDYDKQPDTRIVDSYFSYSAPVLILQNANLTHLARLKEVGQVLIVFDGVSSIGGGYFLGLPADPYIGQAGEVMELIELKPWYWTVVP